MRHDVDAPLRDLIDAYDPSAALADASTIPSAWYLDERVAELERRSVFARNWQVVGRSAQVESPGRYLTADVAGEPIAVVRGSDQRLRAFFNVCRHHAAAVLSEACGEASSLRCPYHGWTYSLEGELRATPEFEGVGGFERARNGLVPLAVAEWEGFVLVRIAPEGPSLAEHVGELASVAGPLALGRLRFLERRSYELRCNWKVYVDNYLDGGYHVPHLHGKLSGMLDHASYSVEIGERHCVQSSPLLPSGDAALDAVRPGRRATYLWLHPNFMINVYDGVMDTNLVLPAGPDRCRVVFDFYFADTAEGARSLHTASIAVAEGVQAEDAAICESVQRGLASRSFDQGRLSPRREAGEHLFHRLLTADLRAGLGWR